MNNPWRLSAGEIATLDAMCETGHTKRAATLRDLAHATISAQIWRARQKMNAPNQMMAVLMWDRVRRAA